MKENLSAAAEVFSIAAMGVFGVLLLIRLIHSLRHREPLSVETKVLPGRRAVILIFLGMVLTRIFIYLWSFLLCDLLLQPEEWHMETVFNRLWIHWDTRHYIGIARDGYTAAGDDRLRLVFFPLYPILIRLFSPLTGGNLVYAGAAVSVLFAGGAAVLVYILALQYFSASEALEAVLCFALNPLSVFLCCIYTEAVFLFLTLGSILLRRFGHPWLAALAGMLSAFTRMPGVIVAGFIVIDTLQSVAWHELDGKRFLSACLQVLIVFSGLFLYWGINAAVTGDPLMYMTYQRENWYQAPGTFWNSMGNTVTYFLETAGEEDHWWTWGMQLISMVGIMVLIYFGRPLSFDLLAYSFVYILVVLSPTWLLSAPRYLYGMCTLPLLEVLALRPLPKGVHALFWSLNGILLLLFTYGFTIAVVLL